MDSGLFLRISSHLLVTKGWRRMTVPMINFMYSDVIDRMIGRSYRKLIIIIFETKNIFKGLQA